MSKFKVINRTTRQEQVFNSKELKRFFHCQYDAETSRIKYNNEFNDYAVSEIKKPVESALEIIAFSCLGLAIIVLVTEIVMKWI
tara:strand:+ start:143 stop:394 length:252 start_codon:yes stop_codon:yes gene_type:complete